MGKRYFVANTDNDKKCFSCPLKGMRCNYVKKNGQQCGNRCLVTVPFCWVHTEELFGVRVRPINRYEGDQVGLFAKEDIEKGGHAIIPYFGESIDADDLHERYCNSTGPYAFSNNINNAKNVIDAACERSAASAANAPDAKQNLRTNADLMSVNVKEEDKQEEVYNYMKRNSASFLDAANRNRYVTKEILPMDLLLEKRENKKKETKYSFCVLKSKPNIRIQANTEIICGYGSGYWSKARPNVTTKRYYKNEDKPRREHCDNPDGYHCDSDESEPVDFEEPEPVPDMETPPVTPRAPSHASKKPTYEPRQMYFKGNKGHIVQPKTKEQKMLKQKFPDHVYFQIDEKNNNGNLMVKKPQLLPSKDLSFEKKPSLPQIEEEQQEEPDEPPRTPNKKDAGLPPRRKTRPDTRSTKAEENYLVEYTDDDQPWLPNNSYPVGIEKEVNEYRRRRGKATGYIQSQGTFSLDMTAGSVKKIVECLGGVEDDIVIEMGMAQGNIVAGMLAAGAHQVVGTELNPLAYELVAEVASSSLPERYRKKVVFLIGEKYNVLDGKYWNESINRNFVEQGKNIVVTAIIGPTVNKTLIGYLRENYIAKMVLLADTKKERENIKRWLVEGFQNITETDTGHYTIENITIKLSGSGGSKTLVCITKEFPLGYEGDEAAESDVEINESNCPGAGDGLFAAKDFKKGQIVTQYGGITYDKSLETEHPTDTRYIWYPMKRDYILDGMSYKDKDYGRFINDPKFISKKDYSIEPCGKVNIKFDIGSMPPNSKLKHKGYAAFPVKALRDIKKGEELLGNYGGGGGGGPVSPTVMNMLRGLHGIKEGGSIGLTLPSPEPNYGSRLTMSGRRNIK